MSNRLSSQSHGVAKGRVDDDTLKVLAIVSTLVRRAAEVLHADAHFLGIEVRYRNDRSGQSLLLTVELTDFDYRAILRRCDIYAREGDRLSENGRAGCARHNANLCAP